MKILMISPTVPFPLEEGIVGGMETYVVNLAMGLARANNSVTLVTSSRYLCTRHIAETYVGGHLQVVRVRSITSFPFSFQNPLFLGIKTFLFDDYDIVHVHQLFTLSSIMFSGIARVRKIPAVLTDHGGGSKPLVALSFLPARFPTAFAAVSNFSLQRLLRLAPNKKHRVIFGGVNTNVFHPHYEVDRLAKRLDLQGFKTILIVGKVIRHKGIEVLIKAFHYLPKNTKLLVVGPIADPNYYCYLNKLTERICPGRVGFTGGVKAEDLPRYYNLCDIYVQPSVYYDVFGRFHVLPELLGLAKFEAMACGKPVIVSKAGGLPEKVAIGVNGLVFEPGNDKQLAYLINELLSDDSMRRKMGAEGLEMIQRDLTWDEISRHTMKFYYSLTSGG